MLETRNIYLDTQTFVQNNYFTSPKLNELFDLAEQGQIKLFLTEITINEIKSNLKEDLQKASTEINHFNRGINNNGKVVKNLSNAAAYNKLPVFDVEMAFKDLDQKLSNVIKSAKITVIDYSNVDTKALFAKYFNHEQPFGIGKKKSEFPDAFVISAVEDWAVKKKEKMYFISGDKDFSGPTFKNIMVERSLSTMLDKINKQINADKYEIISNIYLDNREEVSERIKEVFISKIEDEVGFDISIGEITITNFTLSDYQIEDMGDDYETVLQVNGEVEYEIEVNYEDRSSAFYDKEDDKYYGSESRDVILDLEQKFHAEIIIEADLTDLEDAKFNFKISCSEVNAPDENTITEELDGYVYQF